MSTHVHAFQIRASNEHVQYASCDCGARQAFSATKRVTLDPAGNLESEEDLIPDSALFPSDSPASDAEETHLTESTE